MMKNDVTTNCPTCGECHASYGEDAYCINCNERGATSHEKMQQTKDILDMTLKAMGKEKLIGTPAYQRAYRGICLRLTDKDRDALLGLILV